MQMHLRERVWITKSDVILLSMRYTTTHFTFFSKAFQLDCVPQVLLGDSFPCALVYHPSLLISSTPPVPNSGDRALKYFQMIQLVILAPMYQDPLHLYDDDEASTMSEIFNKPWQGAADDIWSSVSAKALRNQTMILEQ